jgi:mannose-6-phosphate isomerase-like protein (cupin superfamily)
MRKTIFNVLKCGGIALLPVILLTGCKQDGNDQQLKAKEAYLGNIVKETTGNENFRKVLYTGTKSQLVTMSLKPGEDIGEETHRFVEQTIYLYSGTGKAVLNGVEKPLKAGDVVIITPGTKHNIINTGKISLKIFTVYVPANHIDGTVHKTKQDAEQDVADENFAKKVE